MNYLTLITLFILSLSQQCPLQHTPYESTSQCSNPQPIFSNEQFAQTFLNHDVLNNNPNQQQHSLFQQAISDIPLNSISTFPQNNTFSILLILQFYTQLNQWIGFSTDSDLQQAMNGCGMYSNSPKILNLYDELLQFNEYPHPKHINIIIDFIKQNDLLPMFECLGERRTHLQPNAFFKQKKKLKFINKYIQKYAKGKIFNKNRQIAVLCDYVKGFFIEYYLTVSHPSDTFSSLFLRAFTLASDIFGHDDIVPCLSLQSAIELNQPLANLDIDHIYINAPQVFKTIQHLKLRQNQYCSQFVSKIHFIKETLNGINYLNIIVAEQYSQIAAEDNHQKQIQMLAKEVAKAIRNAQKQKIKQKEL